MVREYSRLLCASKGGGKTAASPRVPGEPTPITRYPPRAFLASTRALGVPDEVYVDPVVPRRLARGRHREDRRAPCRFVFPLSTSDGEEFFSHSSAPGAASLKNMQTPVFEEAGPADFITTATAA